MCVYNKLKTKHFECTIWDKVRKFKNKNMNVYIIIDISHKGGEEICLPHLDLATYKRLTLFIDHVHNII